LRHAQFDELVVLVSPPADKQTYQQVTASRTQGEKQQATPQLSVAGRLVLIAQGLKTQLHPWDADGLAPQQLFSIPEEDDDAGSGGGGDVAGRMDQSKKAALGPTSLRCVHALHDSDGSMLMMTVSFQQDLTAAVYWHFPWQAGAERLQGPCQVPARPSA
jgi:hypothetical protein